MKTKIKSATDNLFLNVEKYVNQELTREITAAQKANRNNMKNKKKLNAEQRRACW